jgi:hypothetical protein
MDDGKAYKDGSCIIVYGDTIYCLKGKAKINYFYAYDISQNSWSERSRISLTHPYIRKNKTVKDGGAMTTDGDNIYAIKGGGINEFWVYEPGINIWSPIDTIPRGLLGNKGMPKSGAALAYDGLRVCLLKGNNSNEFWQYTPQVSYVPYSCFSLIPNINEDKPISAGSIFTVSPNPIKENSSIKFTLAKNEIIKISLYNSTGRLINELLNTGLTQGTYSISIDRSNFNAGVYVLNCTIGEKIETFKLIVK